MSAPELPSSWSFPRLDELVAKDAPIVYGIIQPGPEVEGGVPYVRPSEMRDDGIDLDKLRRCSPEVAAKYDRASLREGDIVLAIVGTIGKVAIVPKELEGGNITQSAARIRPPATVPCRYLAHALRAPQLRAQYDAAAFGNAVQRLNVADVRALRIPLAPVHEREGLVAKLDGLRARSKRAKEALDAVPALLDRLRQSILAAAFRGDLTADWREQNPDVEPASELLKRIRVERRKRWEEAQLAKMRAKGKPPRDDRWKANYVEPEPVDETDLPELPESWCWATLDELTLCHDGRRVPVKETERKRRPGPYPYYGASGIIDSIDSYLFDGSYLLVAEDGANLLSRSTPIAFDADGQFWVNNHAHVLEPLVQRGYLRGALNGRDLSPWITGTAQPKLTQRALMTLPIPLAPSAEQATLAASLAAAADAQRQARQLAADGLAGLSTLDVAVLAAGFRGGLLERHDEG